MTSFLTSLYLLSFKQAEILHSSDLDCIKTTHKNICTQGYYCDARNEFFRSRCTDCKQEWGKKKSIKSIVKLFRSYKCIFLSWEMNQPLFLFFSNGSICGIELNNENNTLEKIEIDNNLSGKFIHSRIVDAIICSNYIFVTYAEPKLTVIHTNQESPTLSAKFLGKRRGKLVGFEPKVIHVDLAGPSSKNLERKLSLNCNKDQLLVWWNSSDDDVWPWTPVSYAADRVNMLVYTLIDCIELLCTVKVSGELINAKYSAYLSNQILAIEEVKSEKDTSINVSIYEIIEKQCHHVFISKLPLQGGVVSLDWSSNDKLLVTDSNNLLLIYDLKKKTSIVTNLLFSPKHVRWHPQNCIVLVTDSNGKVQCFDAALTSIKFKLLHNVAVDQSILDLSSHIARSFTTIKLLWQKSNINDSCLFLLDSELSAFVILKFTLGSITRNSLTALEVISQYLKSNLIDEAILLLRSLNWWHASEFHFQCLSKVTNFLLRKPLDDQVQAGMELALGTFYHQIGAFPKRFLKLYQHKVNHIARRFFHVLLRYHQFRKAFLLAVDLESQDLFLDLSHVAKLKGESVLAFVAFHKAKQLNDLQTCTSNSSTASGSTTGTSEESEQEDFNCKESNNTQSCSHEKSVAECSSDNQKWLQVPEKSQLTKYCINSSDMNMQNDRTLSKELSKPNFQLPVSNSLNGASNQHILELQSSFINSNASRHSEFQSTSSRLIPKPPSAGSGVSQPNVYPGGNPTLLFAQNKIKPVFTLKSKDFATLSCIENEIDKDATEEIRLKIISTLSCRPLPCPPSNSSKTSESCNSIHDSNTSSKQGGDKELFVEKPYRFIRQSGNRIDEEGEEIEDSKIKLVHLGII